MQSGAAWRQHCGDKLKPQGETHEKLSPRACRCCDPFPEGCGMTPALKTTDRYVLSPLALQHTQRSSATPLTVRIHRATVIRCDASRVSGNILNLAAFHANFALETNWLRRTAREAIVTAASRKRHREAQIGQLACRVYGGDRPWKLRNCRREAGR